jgi:4-amino-4-deoxy-L-arabinose transferase-like glycosyltransferase
LTLAAQDRIPPAMHLTTPARAAIIAVSLATLIRLILAASMGLGIDESYMIAAAHSFQLSYFDHPGISWWMELAIQRTTSLHTAFVVRLPFIAAFAGTSWLMYRLTVRLYDADAALWAVAALNLSPVFSLAFGTWVLPDGPLDLFLVTAAYALSRALGIGAGPPEPRWWPLAGLFIGLALLSKYTAVLTFAGAFLFLLTDREGRRALAAPAPWLACVIAFAVFSPVIIWNATHHFASFGYQGGRATGAAFHPLRPFIVWAGEALFVLPWIWLPMMFLLIRSLKPAADRRDRFLAMLAIIPVVLFSAIALWSSRKILYHWAAPGYLMLFPLLGQWIASRTALACRRIMLAAIASAVLLAGIVLAGGAELAWGVIPGLNQAFPSGRSPELQAVDWSSVRTELARRGYLHRPHTAIASLRWFDAGKIGFALHGALPVTVFGGDAHEFGITVPPAALIGDDVLIAAMPGDPAATMRHYAPRFARIEEIKPLTVIHDGRVLLRIPLLLGHDLLSWPGTGPQ